MKWEKWTKDNPPPFYHFVFIFCQKGPDEPSCFSIGRWEGDKWNIIGDGEFVWSDVFWGIDSDDEITHWALIEPPKD